MRTHTQRASALLLTSALVYAPAALGEPTSQDATTPPTSTTNAPRFDHKISPLTPAQRAAMQGVTWTEGCPVSLDQLSSVDLSYWDLSGTIQTGTLILATQHAAAVASAFSHLFEARFPLKSVRPAHEFEGSDAAMMRANNTSAFNCRKVTGGSRYSDHSYGHAIDINPLLNPYVRGAQVQPPEGRDHLDRAANTPGLITADGPVVSAFADIDWKWGGHWRTVKDYQHFSSTGR